MKGAIKYYKTDFEKKLESSKVELDYNRNILKENEELLKTTPQIINQKDALDEVESSNTSDFVILENIINPNYTKIESDIITNEQTINNIENTLTIYNNNIEELNELQDGITSNSTGIKELDEKFTNVSNLYISTPSDSIVPNSKSGPDNKMNTLMGGLLGGLVIVTIVLIKEFCLKDSNADKNKSAKQ
jgi:uncharacterized protein involved in exopolysaccharide biosynthesis